MDITQAVANGIANSQRIQENSRKTAAYNALRAVYGDVAGDPDAAVKMQDYGYNEQANPVKLEGLRLGNEGQVLTNERTAQDNSYNALANPLKIQDLQLGNQRSQQVIDQGNQSFPLEQEQRQASIASTRASTASTNQATASKAAEQQRAAGLAMVTALEGVAAQGGDVGGLFDRFAPVIAQMEGVDVAHLGPLRAAIIQDPQRSLAYLKNGLMSGGASTGLQGTPQTYIDGKGQVFQRQTFKNGTVRDVPVSGTSASLLAQNADNQGSIAESKEVGKARGAAKAQSIHGVQDVGKAQMQLDNNELRFDSAQQNLGQALKFSNSAGNAAWATQHIPGTSGANFAAALNSVHSDIVNNVIQSYKESTPQGQASGVGRVMASEINLWQDAYAAVEASQSADVRAQNLKRLMAVTQRLRQTSRQYFGNVYGVKASGNAPAGNSNGWKIEVVK